MQGREGQGLTGHKWVVCGHCRQEFMEQEPGVGTRSIRSLLQRHAVRRFSVCLTQTEVAPPQQGPLLTPLQSGFWTREVIGPHR